MKLFRITLLLIFLIGCTSLFATHIPGGNITYECTGVPNEFIVTMELYVSCPATLGAQQTLIASNDCALASPVVILPQVGSPQEITSVCPSQQSQSTCYGGTIAGINIYTYQSIITLPGQCDSWTFAFDLCCRNIATNLAGGSSNNMYFNTVLNSLTAPCDNSPYITTPPSPFICVGIPQSYCPGVIDPDGDSLYYQLVSPSGISGNPITHNLPYTPLAPLLNFNFDSLTGCINFNQPFIGNFVVAYLIEAYDSLGNMTGSIVHDFQFQAISCSNTPPVPNPPGVTLTSGSATQLGPDLLEICEGESTCFDLTFTDINALDTLSIDTVFSSIFSLMPGATITTSGTNPFVVNVCWTIPDTMPAQLTVSLAINDGACPVIGTAFQNINFNILENTFVNPDLIICGNQTAQLTAVGGSVFTWYYTVTGVQVPVGSEFSCNPCANPIATPLISTDYYVISNLSLGCGPNDSTTVTVVSDYTATAFGDTLLCDFLPRNIGINVVPGGAGYLVSWTPAATLDNATSLTPVASPTATTNYIATVTSPFGCAKTDTVTISVIPPSNLTVLPGDTNICLGDTLQFDVLFTVVEDDFTGAFDPSVWNTVSGATVATPCVPFSGTALIFDNINRSLITNSTNVANCTSIDFCLWIGNGVLSGPAPCENADAGEDVELSYSINGGATWVTIQLFDNDDWDVAGPYPNLWQCFSIPVPAGAVTANTMFQWAQIGTYGGTIDNWSLDNIAINCGGNTNYSYSWAPSTGLSDDTISNPIALPLVTTTYTVTLTDTIGCSFDRGQTITVSPNYMINITPNDTVICQGDSINFNVIPSVAGVYSYLWTPGATLNDSTIAMPIASPLNTTDYIVTVISGLGCIKIDTVSVELNPIPVPILLPGDTSICQGNSIQLDATFPSFFDDFNAPLGSNWCSIQNGTLNTDCGSISGNALHFDGPIPAREAITKALDVLNCSAVNFSLFIGNTLSAAPPCEDADNLEGVELWYSTTGCGGPWISIQTFDADDWDAGGPFSNIWASFSIPIPAGAQTIATHFKWNQPSYSGCVGCDNWALDDVSLNCGGSIITGIWSPGIELNDSTINNPIATPTSTTNYIFTISDTSGCTVQLGQTITVSPNFMINLSPNDTNICLGDSINFNVIPDVAGVYTYLWTPGGLMNDSIIPNPVQTFSSTGTTQFIVSVEDGGCVKLDTVNITVSLCTGIEDFEDLYDIEIFPNPSQGLFTLTKPSDLSEKIEIQVFSVEGKLILEKFLGENESAIQIDLTNYKSGLYLLHLKIGKATFARKILKD